MKATNVLYWANDLAASRDFYSKVGFEVKSDTPRFVELSLDDFGITLVPMSEAEPEFAGDAAPTGKGKGYYLYLQVSDADAKYAELKAAGIEPATAPRDWAWGNREFIVKDPDGFKMCFWQPVEKK
jgi:catechol 2,3-dioxygenase-like lactoylglutathione lyase family enzyme